MGFLAPAVPWLAKGAASIGASLLGKKLSGGGDKRSPEEQQAVGGMQDTGAQLQQTGQQATSIGLPAAKKAIGYYQSLLGGNRAQMAQATAAPRAAITDVYRGAERNIDHDGLRGASKDRAEADLSRDRAAKIAGLTTGVQPGAADALASTGVSTAGLGTNALGNAGSIYSSLLGQGAQNRQYGRAESERGGAGMGGLIFDILAGDWKKPGAKSGGGGPLSKGPYQTPPYFPTDMGPLPR